MTVLKKKILVGLDGSEQSLAAVKYLGEFFPSGEREFVLFHVSVEIPDSFWDFKKDHDYDVHGPMIKALEKYQGANVREFMDKAFQVLLESGVSEEAVSVKVQKRIKGIARDIITESSQGYDAVIVGNTGKGKIKGLVLGSIANKLRGNLLNVPLCVVGGNPDPGKILVAMDASEGAMRAVDCLSSLIEGGDHEVMLFHAIKVMSLQTVYPDTPPLTTQMEYDLVEDGRKTMGRIFKESKDRLIRAGLDDNKVDCKITPEAHSRAWAIIMKAEKEGCGTIVLGRRGLSKVEDFFIGRVSNKVLELANKRAVWIVS